MPKVKPANLRTNVHIGLVVEKPLYLALKGLADEHDVKLKFLLKRMIIDIVNTRRIPWPGMSQAPTNTQVPTYDAAESASSLPVKTDGRKHPVPPAV